MARLPRIVVPHQSLHIMHRDNNRQDIFESVTKLAAHGGDRKSEVYKDQVG